MQGYFLILNGRFAWPVSKTLFHELGHNTDKNSREGIVTKEQLQNAALEHGRFYEWSNTVFERLVSGNKFYKKDDAMILCESGYEAVAPLGSMLASALGISEAEFAKLKDKGKAYETEFFATMFSGSDGKVNPEIMEKIENLKELFDKYILDSYMSPSKKIANQKVLNLFYTECIELLSLRVKNDIENGRISNEEQYKKQQMFWLKKINTNYKYGTKKDGSRLLRKSIIHDIGYCTDDISKHDAMFFSEELTSIVDFGFDNSTLSKYKRAMTTTKDKTSFDKKIRLPIREWLKGREKAKNTDEKEKSVTTVLPTEHTKDD